MPETAERALQHFFSPGNLTALRELVMRTAAEHVDADVRNWRRARAIEQPWRTQERLMVLVGDSREGLRLVRLGRRLAGTAHAAWLVVHVAPPEAAAPAGADHVTEAFKLAEELGAETALLTGEDVVREILDCAAERNVTQIVVGRSARRWRFLTLQGSLANVLQREARNVDITVAAATDSRETPERVRLPPVSSWSHRGAGGYATAIVWTGASAVVAWSLDPWLETANLGLVFLTGVLISAARAGVGPALVASGLSFLFFNFFLTEPRYTFYVKDERDVLTLTFFLLVALVTGQLAARVRRQMETIRANSRRIASLEDFSRRLTGIVGRDDLAWVLTEYLRTTLAVDAIVLLRDYAARLAVVAGDVGRDGLSDTETAAAQWASIIVSLRGAARGHCRLPGGSSCRLWAASGARRPCSPPGRPAADTRRRAGAPAAGDARPSRCRASKRLRWPPRCSAHGS